MRKEQLDYAPVGKPRWRGGIWAGLWSSVAACALAYAAVTLQQKVLGPMYWRWQVNRARVVCASCVMPAGRVALEFDGKNIELSGSAAPSPADDALRRLGLHHDGNDLVFVHQRRTRGGATRIVIVSIDKLKIWATHGGASPFDGKLLGEPTATDPKGFMYGGALEIPEPAGKLAFRLWSGHPLRIFSGQADAADESHFTIEYLWDGKPGTLDGYLESSGPGGFEYVRLEDRAAKASAATTPGLGR
jgi:hypothetical protein